MTEDTQDQVGSDAEVQRDTPAAKQTESAPVKDNAGGESQTDDHAGDADDDGAESGEQPKKQPKDRLQKRIDSITRSAREAQREAADLRERLARLEGRAEASGEKPNQAATDKPRLEDYSSYDAYQEALTDWKVEQKLSAKEQERQKAERQRSQQTVAQERRMRFVESSDAAREKYDDYDDVVIENKELKITPAMADLISETDNPGEVAYYLGKNPSEAARLAKLSPAKIAIELGKVEVKLSTPAAKKTTSAPPPAGKLAGGRTARAADPNSPDAIYAKYVGK